MYLDPLCTFIPCVPEPPVYLDPCVPEPPVYLDPLCNPCLPFMPLCRKYLTVGDCFGEVAFFTEIPQMQTVRTVTVCRVLVVPRSAYHSIKSAFPLGTRQVLDNLQAHAEMVGTLHPCGPPLLPLSMPLHCPATWLQSML